MSRIKGRYVAQVIMDIDMDSNSEMDSMPVETMRENLSHTGAAIKDVIQDEILPDSMGTIEVVEQYRDIYKVEDEDGQDNDTQP